MRSLPFFLLAGLAACGGSKALPPDGSTDDGEVPPPIVTLAFEAITLPNTPLAITNLVHVPGTASDFLLLEKTGQIHHYVVTGTTATERANVVVPGVDTTADCGLISLAFDPDYASNHFVFVGSCVSPTHSRITRHVYDPDSTALFGSSAVTIITVGDDAAPEPWHNVGSIGFTDGGALWALFGDKVLNQPAQDPSSELGSVVRIVPSRTPGVGGYTPAPSNPFALDADADTNANVIAKGLRSPWKGTLDRFGRLFIGDVGLSDTEEVNVLLPSDETPNFGWPSSEGPCNHDCPEHYAAPLRSFRHANDDPFARADPEANQTTRRVVWVGASYFPVTDRYEGAFTDHLVYGDFCAGFVRALSLDDAGALVSDRHVGHLEGITGMVQAGDDYLYVSTYGNCYTFPYEPGKLYRVLPVVE